MTYESFSGFLSGHGVVLPHTFSCYCGLSMISAPCPGCWELWAKQPQNQTYCSSHLWKQGCFWLQYFGIINKTNNARFFASSCNLAKETLPCPSLPCVHTGTCMCMCMACVWMHVEVKGQPWLMVLKLPSTLSLRQGFSMVWYSPSRSGWLSSKPQGHACLCFSVTEPKMPSFLSLVLIFARLTSYYFYHCLQLDIGIYDKFVYVKSVTQVQKLQDGHLGDHRLNFTILRSGTQGVLLWACTLFLAFLVRFLFLLYASILVCRWVVM